MSTPKVIPLSTILRVWALLFGLTAINIALAYLPIGTWVWPITYSIAVVMMLLIMTFYMHLRESTVVVRLFAAAGYLWLMLFFSIALADYLTRPQLYLP